MDKVSQKSVDYRKGNDKRHCGNCVMFHASAHSCDLVEGYIESDCVCNKWEARKVSAETTNIAAVSMQARALDIKTDGHVNKMPFSGVLTRIGEPSDAAPDGSNGRRVMITMEAAEKALDSILGMGVDYQPNFDGHDPQAKIGVITAAKIVDNAINVNGYIYAADFPEVAKTIKANKKLLGMSFEARELWTTDKDADPMPIVDCEFTGAAILFKDKAAYKTTSIAAKDAAIISQKDDFEMTDEIKKQLADLATAVTTMSETIKAQGEKLTKFENDKVEAANHLAKVERHAAELEKAAEHMDAAGVGGDADRGHAKILRDMAGDIRAQAAQGRIPSAFYSMRAAAAPAVPAVPTFDLNAQVEKAVAAERAESEKKLADVKAAAAKEVEDAKAAAETKIADMKAEAQRKAEEAANVPARKTLAPTAMKLLAKAGVELPGDGAKIEIGKLDKAFTDAALTQDQRWSLKTALANIGAID